MPHESFNISERQAEFIGQLVRQGKYPDQQAVVDAALTFLQTEMEEQRKQFEEFQRLVKEGFDAHDRGEYEIITPDNIGAFMDSVSAPELRNKSA